MGKTVLIIQHQPVRRADRVTRGLAKRGVTIDVRVPAVGQDLPRDIERYSGMVVFGGEQSVNDPDLPWIDDEIRFIESWLKIDRPYFGICLGGQLLARALGARVQPHPEGLYEIGYRRIEPTEQGNGFLPAPLFAYQWHQEGFELPAGAIDLARGDRFTHQAYRYDGHVYGVQFHPEITPMIMETWFDAAGHMLMLPGAHDAERQRSDRQRHDGESRQWLDGFLDHWVESCPAVQM